MREANVREEAIRQEIVHFFGDILEVKEKGKSYRYAAYTSEWLGRLGLTSSSPDESKSARTTKELQNRLTEKFPGLRAEVPVAERMTLRFGGAKEEDSREIDSSKLQAFDLLDEITGAAFEISLSDAFAEFFKDVLKALLDSRVKKLYLCMRNHIYKDAGKSGFIKVASSAMVEQYILLAKLYKLDIVLVDLLPACNE